MDAGFEPGIANGAHHVRAAAPDVGPRQQCSVQQRTQTVMRQHAGALDLAEEARAEHPLDRAPGVIRTQAPQERRPRAVAAELVDERRHAFAGAAKRIDVHFEGEQHRFVRTRD